MTDLPKNQLMTPALLNLVAGCDPEAPEPNRWDAFTDDELSALLAGIIGTNGDIYNDFHLAREIAAELKRRGDVAGTIAPDGREMGRAPVPIPPSDAP